jgi:hypothetical protein
MTRKYSSISVETTLQTGIGTSETTITAPSSSAVTLLLGGVSLAAGNVDQFTVVIDPDTANEEILFVTGVSGANMTVVRARAGTAAVAHTAGAVIRHSLTSDDLTYYTTGVDSAATAAGTLTFTNKTIALGSNSVSGTTAQFNTALTDGDFATLAGTETLTAKTLTTPVASIAINAQTTAYTLVATDKSKLVTLTSATAANITVPPSVFAAGDIIYVARLGAGTCSLTAGAGVTINTTPGLSLRAQNSTAALICTASNTFLATGDLS